MRKIDINNIKKMLNAYNELIYRIKELNAENKKIMSIIESLNALESSDNIDKAITALEREYELNSNYIIEYTMQANDYDERIENAYDDERNYKDELRQDAINTYRTSIANATSDVENSGFSIEHLKRHTEQALTWLDKRLKSLDVITSNAEAFAFMINTGAGEI